MDSDLAIRLAAFRFLEEQVAIHGDVLPWSVLSAGFRFEGERVPLVSQQGIFKPRRCRLPLSIRTSVGGPYDDAFDPGGLLQYRYRGTEPFHRENVGLREAMKGQVPLVYLHGHVEARYHAVWPVFVVGDSPATLTFTVAADEANLRPVAPGEVARALRRAAEALLEVLSGEEEQLGANLASKAREILGRLAEVLGDEPLAERIRSFAAQEEPSPGALEA